MLTQPAMAQPAQAGQNGTGPTGKWLGEAEPAPPVEQMIASPIRPLACGAKTAAKTGSSVASATA